MKRAQGAFHNISAYDFGAFGMKVKTPAALPPSELMDLNTNCAYLNKSRSWVYKAINRMGLPAHRMGTRWVFSKPEVDDWIRALPGVNLPSPV